MVSIQAKKACLHWFLNRHQVKQRDSLYLLHFLMREESLLTQVHFVYDVQYAPRGILISAEGANKPAFKFYKNHLVTTEVDKAFHDIRLNKDEPLYIELSFLGVKRSLDYHRVLEDNPFIPDDYYLNESDKQTIDALLNQTLSVGYETWLRKEIDRCLDEGDLDQFQVLSEQLTHYLTEDKHSVLDSTPLNKK
ncbi:Uncharacterized protein YpiB, UPF0302 family [Halolactibacillus halophilus]|uniref:UPF0302 protein YpiB n=1 Tax=Halolactibacillus halophilus TaxID=306540 RepID=A0A1I5PB68_9BACI|nr:ReoY family proteolytic degradation factor [Halolactibacillus halophilus]GEM02845.1 UPF0302 protein YpiB [Halolactibacillus halophilus]SFP30761.1 Uncharacterized protein YpiB, UPF0302 family [Halolactibacillus halophilus]